MWDSKKAGMMQAAHDAELQRVLRRLARLLYAALLDGTLAAPQTPPSSPRPGPRRAARSSVVLDILLWRSTEQVSTLVSVASAASGPSQHV